MKIGLLLIVSAMPVIALADDALPKRPDFNRYQAMLNRSFAIETVVPTTIPNSAKDLYIANIACTGKDCVVTLTSPEDKNFKKDLPAKRPDEHDFDNIYIDLRP